MQLKYSIWRFFANTLFLLKFSTKYKKNYMKRFAFVFFVTILCLTGFSQKNGDVNCEVRQVTSKLLVSGSQMFYVLPKNAIRIDITLKKTTQFKGPYSKYAQKYLNIGEGVILMNDEFFTIESVSFNRFSIPDSSRFYSLNCTGYNDLPLLQLNHDGVLIGCNLNTPVKGYSTEGSLFLKPYPKTEEFQFVDLGVKPFFTEKTKKMFKYVQTDTVPVKVPYTKTSLQPTSDDFNADEVSALIRKIRKRRMKLVMGYKDETFAVDGEAMKKMVEELDNYEKRYLELFVGKTIEKQYTYSFYYEPEEDSDAEQKIIGWFSQSKGLSVIKLNIRRSDYQPLVVKSQTLGKVPDSEIQVIDNTQKNPFPIKYGLYYRIPGRISMCLYLVDRKIACCQIEIAQKGRVIPLPVGYLNNQKYSIEFYPETGALKGIYLNSF